MPSNKELIERAYAAWLSYRPEPRPPTPTLSASSVETYDDLVYVVLRSGGQVVDVYRYLPNEKVPALKRLRRNWPGPYGRQRVAA